MGQIPETLEVWIVCIVCGKESQKKKLTKDFVLMCEKQAGQHMRPSPGWCPECQEMAKANPMYEEGAF